MQTQKKVVLFGSNPKPSLDLDFSKAAIPASLTFTRTTVATVMAYAPTAVAGDLPLVTSVAINEARFQNARRISQGVWSNVLNDGSAIPLSITLLVEEARTNLFINSNDLTAITTTLGNASGTATKAANALHFGANAGDYLYMRIGNLAASTTISIRIVLSGTGTVKLNIAQRDSNFGTPITVVLTATPTVYSITGTNGAGGEAGYTGIFIGSNGTASDTTLGQWQLEAAPSSSSYIPTTTVAVTRAADVASFTGNAAWTNLCLQSETFSSATWVKDNTTVAANAYADPYGVMTADGLSATAGNGTLIQSITSASATRVFSIWLKRIVGTGAVALTIDEGSTWTTVTITTDWHRYAITNAGISNPKVGIRLATNANVIAIWGAQLENGTVAGGYLPTVASAVSSAATGPDWYNHSQGTFAITASGSAFKAPSDFGALSLTYASATRYLLGYNNGVKNGSTYIYTAATVSNPTEYTGVAVPTTIYVNAAGIANISKFTYYPKVLKANKMAALL
jgi:hypothetical protein